MKYDKLFPALALIFHLVNCADDSSHYGDVTESAATLAVFWCEYLESHARRCYGLLADAGARAAQALVKKIISGKLEDGFTAHTVRRPGWSHLKKPEEVQAALSWLEETHWISARLVPTGPKGGCPTISYDINPKAKKHEALLGDAMA